jgi:hypothetical protein
LRAPIQVQARHLRQPNKWLRTCARWNRLAALERLNGWLPKLSHPVRIGEHDQTAFALGFMLDYARASGDTKFADMLVSCSLAPRFSASDFPGEKCHVVAACSVP